MPAIAAILKTRKRKLAQISSGADSALLVNTEFLQNVRVSLETINVKLSSLLYSDDSAVSSNINKNLNVFSIKSEIFRGFNTQLFTKCQIMYILYA